MAVATVIFDLSTYPLSPGHIPRMYYGCCYLVEWRRYEHYDPRNDQDIARLIGRLTNALELVSFNGEAFDLQVLRHHHGLAIPAPKCGIHTDLAVVLGTNGRGGSLDEAAWLNLGVRKTNINTLQHDPERRTHARQACQADVRLTYRLWKLYKAGTLKFP